MDEEPQGQNAQPVNFRLEKVRREFPLITDEKAEQAREFGELLVSDISLVSPNGLLQTAEELSEKTEDLTDQVRVELLTGACRGLTNAVFSEIGIIPSTERNQKEWRQRFEYEFDYLKRLLSDRAKIRNKFYAYGPNATVDLLQRIEYADTLDETKRNEYLNRIAQEKAVENLGIKEEDVERYGKEIGERKVLERAYYQDAIDKYSKSEGKRKLSYMDS